MLDTQNANGFHEDLVRRVGPKLDSQALPGQYHRTLGVKTQTHLSDLTPASRALLLSQAGPRDDVTIPSALFRVLLLRRLRLPLPLAPRRCSCRGQLDPSGDHRAACATSGVLPTRALPLELTVARVCREAGARVARNVRLADMNVDVPVADARRIEVVANGLPPLAQVPTRPSMPLSCRPSRGLARPTLVLMSARLCCQCRCAPEATSNLP